MFHVRQLGVGGGCPRHAEQVFSLVIRDSSPNMISRDLLVEFEAAGNEEGFAGTSLEKSWDCLCLEGQFKELLLVMVIYAVRLVKSHSSTTKPSMQG